QCVKALWANVRGAAGRASDPQATSTRMTTSSRRCIRSSLVTDLMFNGTSLYAMPVFPVARCPSCPDLHRVAGQIQRGMYLSLAYTPYGRKERGRHTTGMEAEHRPDSAEEEQDLWSSIVSVGSGSRSDACFWGSVKIAWPSIWRVKSAHSD